MKFRTLALFSLLLVVVTIICDLEARGGRGGGGGGRGGGSISRGGGSRGPSVSRGSYGGGPSYSRAPTMSRSQPYRGASQVRTQRPSYQPSRPSQIARPNQRADIRQGGQTFNRPSQGFNRSAQEINRPSQLPNRPSQLPARPSQVPNRPSQIANRPVQKYNRPAQRPNRPSRGEFSGDAREKSKQVLQNARNTNFDKGVLDQKRNAFVANRGERDRLDRVDAENIGNRIKNNWRSSDQWFGRDFFDRHNYHPAYWNNNANWWTPAAWAGLAGWLAWDWNEPIYYEDGYYPITTEDTSYVQPSPAVVNTNTPTISTAPAATPTATNVTGDWYPLGVFAVGKNEQLAANSFMFVQLALNKNGDIAGTYYNATTDQTRELVGAVDRNTQQAAWSISDNPNSPVISTGLYNLTKDITDVAVDFPDGTTQTWTFVRMQQ